MKDRIIKFLTSENKSSAQFADEIGVQPSGVSHILSGRNNPSLDFVLKMLTRYSFISPEWLLFGKEPMYRGHSQPTLFDGIEESASEEIKPIDQASGSANIGYASADMDSDSIASTASVSGLEKRDIERIVFFYTDNSFEEYRPSGKLKE